MALTLVIGNKAYSSWSLRPWLLLANGGVAFDEVRIPLYRDDSAAALAPWSPTGKVPVLIDDGLTICDSLAIAEYLAERFPDRCGWPAAVPARAVARSASAEMHAGFAALRSEMPFNCRSRRRVSLSDAATQDVRRVQALWADCRRRFGAGGPWLFGAFSPADAMFAPVALRFVTYGAALDAPARAYVDAVAAHPAVQAWIAAARTESEVIAGSEVGEPA
ncbi:MAG TPA: glutathione S-transferase family protein [Candidatus Dormibacteraeota bacterium]|nr:glutathione S-transferase family protein [Candidatus Dormibacteraeota bacterium]